MGDTKNVAKDMFKQRIVQGVTGIVAVVSLAFWFIGHWWGTFLAAIAIILFTVATLHWIDDEEVLEKEHLGAQPAKK